MRRYVCTDELRYEDGKFYFHRDMTWMADEPDGNISSDMWARPDIFRVMEEDHEDAYSLANMWRGRFGFPRYAYDPETDEFEKVDTWKLPWARHATRRLMINRDIEWNGIKVQTELKRMRKALKAIVRAMPALRQLEEVQDFMGLSDALEKRIAFYTKDDEMAEEKAFYTNAEYDEFFMGGDKVDTGRKTPRGFKTEG
jgi:hypothetical protein